MKKLSLAKIIAALVIVNCYMFTCGVMGTVGDAQMLTEDTSEEHSRDPLPPPATSTRRRVRVRLTSLYQMRPERAWCR